MFLMDCLIQKTSSVLSNIFENFTVSLMLILKNFTSGLPQGQESQQNKRKRQKSRKKGVFEIKSGNLTKFEKKRSNFVCLNLQKNYLKQCCQKTRNLII